MLYFTQKNCTPKAEKQKENQKQFTRANYILNFIINLETSTQNTAIAVDSNKSTDATRQEKVDKFGYDFLNPNKQSCAKREA